MHLVASEGPVGTVARCHTVPLAGLLGGAAADSAPDKFAVRMVEPKCTVFAVYLARIEIHTQVVQLYVST